VKATEANLLKFLKKSPQFIIPIYQRNYSWTAAQCHQLWDDLLKAGRNDDVQGHFIGSIVYIERDLSTVTSQESLLVIDGQQRLTTTTLIIAALAEHFEKQGLDEILGAFSAKKLRNYYLFNPEEEGEQHFKLLLSETDKDTLLAILQNAPAPTTASKRIAENHKLFKDLVGRHHQELDAICQGLAKLLIVDISLDRAHDNPQLIFESMNSTGLELSQADLIRNYILMGLEPALQTELYKSYWRPMELSFGQVTYVRHFDPFMRHYLTVKTGEIPKKSQVYAAFKRYAAQYDGDVRSLVADIHTYANYYCAIALGKEPDKRLEQAFADLRELKVDVAYPFLLDVYHDYQNNRLPAEDALRIVRLVESYVFRRAICAIPTNSLNKTFAGLNRKLKKDRYVESVCAALLLLPSYRRFPRDEEFQREIQTRDLYHFRSRSYWIRRLENDGRKERVQLEDYSVEHIMPQNEQLSSEWQKELGSEWQRIQGEWLHTLGNLTLTGYNSEYSDRPFAYKRNEVTDTHGDKIGLAHSPLRLNKGFSEVGVWDEDAIKRRAERLSNMAAKVWQAPQVSADVLDAYRPRKQQFDVPYTIHDHPHLSDGAPMRALFQALRSQVLDIDPCVSEEFWKLYVAYKAETNFVDVVPQVKRLRLTLNMPFHAIDDPKQRCADVAELGRWGNGDVEITLCRPDELPYVMTLIRQAFEQQMGEQEEA